MRRRLVALSAVLLLGVATTACNNDDDRPLADVTTTTAKPTTTTASTIPSGPPATEEGAAQGLFDAWQRGDREGASRYAKPGPIGELFAHPNTGDVKYDDQGCEPQGGQFICSWTYPGGALQMTVEAWPGGGFVVDDVTYLVD
ncbi:MAG: hypothetical protein QOI61_174 [Actinomycetota bacterium]